ncbi:hypothetical protein GS966_28595 [Rhodococcus hoagii]|nr:hypothetical protein [Prescottella equi]NKS10247.1 hypothetical protein [Prescottella equi]NKS35238.1 hypothetical protein [Prescottella equi]NKS62085.1 hypothetical protein [Prescottella equi]NKS68245.1 hypothetical protein [Prescottella equi]
MTPSDQDLEQITGLTSDDLRRRGGVFTRDEIARLIDSDWQLKARAGEFATDDDRRLWESYFEGIDGRTSRGFLQSWTSFYRVLLLLCAAVVIICLLTQM